MKVCGVICELNPFTLGHEYLFKNARSATGADYIIAVLSGDFVQRGMPAIVDKYTRCTAALNGGADLVIELPTIYATASADYFAYGGVTLLDSLGCVDFLCFGSESGDIDYLRSMSGHRITSLLQEGISYPKAYSRATGSTVASNDMLGIRYIKSIDMRSSSIKPVIIKRRGSGYLDEGADSESAGAVRRRILNKEDYAHLVPKYSYRGLQSKNNLTFPITLDDFSGQLYGILDTLIYRNEELSEYMDSSLNIAGHIVSQFGNFLGYEQFADLIHSKEYTKSRIYRALLHIMLDIAKSDYPDELADCEAYYARILGFRNGSTDLLARIKDTSVIPIISKASDACKILDDEAMYIFNKDIHAASLYESACALKYKKSSVSDFAQQIVIV